MKQEIVEQITALKKQKNAVILAHFYAPDEAQQLADFVGDSFYLAKIAKNCTADTLVFCGVSFMGESAKILNPDKTVLMPDLTADCPMAHMASEQKIKEMRAKYDDLAVVCYINSTAALKCMSDVCVTSSNALSIVNALPNHNILFIPDENLGRFVQQQCPDKNIILNDGYCPIHAAMDPKQLALLKKKHPLALVLTHPECGKEVVEQSDFVGSTAGIIDFATESEALEFIICTEMGVDFRLGENNPDKKFYFVGTPQCMDMKLNTAENILRVLTTGENEVIIEESVRQRALEPLEKMLELAK